MRSHGLAWLPRPPRKCRWHVSSTRTRTQECHDAEHPYEASLITRLARVAAEDPAWNVRYSALDTLATYGAKKDVLDALRRADSDPDKRVRQRAAEALVALRRR